MQIHHWLEQYLIPPEYKSKYPVGEWTLADRLIVYRGEYLARKALVELPVWLTRRNNFVLAESQEPEREACGGLLRGGERSRAQRKGAGDCGFRRRQGQLRPGRR